VNPRYLQNIPSGNNQENKWKVCSKNLHTINKMKQICISGKQQHWLLDINAMNSSCLMQSASITPVSCTLLMKVPFKIVTHLKGQNHRVPKVILLTIMCYISFKKTSHIETAILSTCIEYFTHLITLSHYITYTGIPRLVIHSMKSVRKVKIHTSKMKFPLLCT
jgi:hypothetical protein